MKGLVPTIRTWLFGDGVPGSPGRPRIAQAKHYDLADTNRENRDQWRDADCWDADKCNDPQTRQTSRNRSRLETDNNPSLKGNVKTLVNYELGRGSTFWFELPLAAASAEPGDDRVGAGATAGGSAGEPPA